jgi:membrane protease YdiL (CAAX protease family)
VTKLSDTPKPAWIYATPDRPRRSWGFVPILMSVVLSLVALGLLSIIYATAGSQIADLQDWLAGLGTNWTDLGLTAEMIAMLGVFGLSLALVLGWVFLVERRGLPSLGFVGPGWWLRWVRGVLIGIGLVLMLDSLAGGLYGLDHPGEGGSYLLWVTANMDLSQLLQPSLLVGYALIALIFFFQSFTEEVMFRGWMMSALAARWGLIAALIVNSVVFGLFHSHHFLAGWALGGVAVLGLTMVGAFLSLLALSERSIAGAAGVHGGFNAGLILFYSAAGFLEDPKAGAGAAAADVLHDATGSEDSLELGLTAVNWAQAILFGAFVLYVIYRLKTRRAPLLSGDV